MNFDNKIKFRCLKSSSKFVANSLAFCANRVEIGDKDDRREPMATILVVDDEKNIRTLYTMELSKEGYKVLTAETAEEAMDILDREKVDVVILDIRLPGMHGIDALEKMIVKRRDLAVIINTAYGEYRDDFLTWLAEDYIIKSSDLTQLKEKIKQVLARRKKL